MATIRVDVKYPISDGTSLAFRAPCSCSEVDRLLVYHPTSILSTSSITAAEFVFADAHKNILTGIGDLFTEGVLVRVVLDVTQRMAIIQNADTNKYLEDKIGNCLRKDRVTGGLVVSGEYVGIQGDFLDKLRSDLTTKGYVDAKFVAKNQGVENAGKILVVGTDGNLTLVDMPTGG